MNIWCILEPSSHFTTVIFPTAALWNSFKRSVIKQIKKFCRKAFILNYNWEWLYEFYCFIHVTCNFSIIMSTCHVLAFFKGSLWVQHFTSYRNGNRFLICTLIMICAHVFNFVHDFHDSPWTCIVNILESLYTSFLYF